MQFGSLIYANVQHFCLGCETTIYTSYTVYISNSVILIDVGTLANESNTDYMVITSLFAPFVSP